MFISRYFSLSLFLIGSSTLTQAVPITNDDYATSRVTSLRSSSSSKDEADDGDNNDSPATASASLPAASDFEETPSFQNIIHAFNGNDLSQLQDLYPGVLLRRLTQELKNAEEGSLSEAFLWDTYLKGLFSIYASVSFTGELPTNMSLFIQTLKEHTTPPASQQSFSLLKINRLQRKALENLCDKGIEANVITQRGTFLKTFFPEHDKRLNIVLKLLHISLKSFEGNVRKVHNLPSETHLLDLPFLLRNEKLLNIAIGFGTPEATFHAKSLAQDSADQKDLDTAIIWATKAARAGDTSAMVMVGAYYDEKGNIEKAIAYYRNAAKEADPLAMNNLADLLLERGTARDNEEAEDWLRKAASAEDPEALNRLASLLDEKGNPEDKREIES